MSTKVVNKTNEEYDVYIGRGSKWGNPFVIGVNGTRKQVISKYKDYLLNNNILLDDLHELTGKRLGCFCKPLDCHGDVLKELIDELG